MKNSKKYINFICLIADDILTEEDYSDNALDLLQAAQK